MTPLAVSQMLTSLVVSHLHSTLPLFFAPNSLIPGPDCEMVWVINWRRKRGKKQAKRRKKERTSQHHRRWLNCLLWVSLRDGDESQHQLQVQLYHATFTCKLDCNFNSRNINEPDAHSRLTEREWFWKVLLFSLHSLYVIVSLDLLTAGYYHL